MPPLNPFLRAFFRSIIPSQCVPTRNHVLLVPTTESLINAHDQDSNALYLDLVSAEDFLGSHVLRISTATGASGIATNSSNKEASSIRDNRGKIKQISTVNGRTVVLKESFVYSNKGFKTLNQAQLLSDALYYTPNRDAEPWLIYYISKPLIGTYDPGGIPQAIVPGYSPAVLEPTTRKPRREAPVADSATKEVKSFGDLLTRFPMISRQMQPGLDRVLSEFGKELGKPLPPPPTPFPASPQSLAARSSPSSVTANEPPWSLHRADSELLTYGRLPFGTSLFEDDEDVMRRAWETAVTAAIDLFRLVDKQQLSLLGATTDLTGPMVERLIERYIAEQVHEPLLFPRLCACREAEDRELDRQIRRMEAVDVSQVGIAIEGGRKGKEELILRLGKGVDEFRKMVDSKSPQAMLEILLATLKTITMAPHYQQSAGRNGDGGGGSFAEKKPSVLTINADILVSLLLVVVIRAQVHHLQARLLYMQQFVFTDDVESGESGYALSTFEGVLTYLRIDSAGLRNASSRNKRLWSATKAGKISEMQAILEPDLHNRSTGEESPSSLSMGGSEHQSPSSSSHTNGNLVQPQTTLPGKPSASPPPPLERPETPRLGHVFPFQTWSQNHPSVEILPKTPVQSRKRVTMDTRSLSEFSTMSLLSRSTTGASFGSAIEGDTSVQSISQTQGPAGDSVPMMAVEAHQPQSLTYLLSLEEYYPVESILEDANSDGTTLLSAAVQLGHTELVDILLDFITSRTLNPRDVMVSYFAKTDGRGRTAAHYVFCIPSLISRLGNMLPWRQKDKNGQTPLFALCRSYDHPDYNSMVNEGLTAAQEAQGDGQPLRLDDHIDAKGNTLLHAVSDPQIISRMLKECDCNPNATNERKFTPLMMASKYGRVDLVRIFFGDCRVDVHMREARGLTAIELAKDDGVRSRIDDLTLFSQSPSPPRSSQSPSPSNELSSRRVTTVVRSVFVEDGTVRFIIKSGAPNPPNPSDPNSDKYTMYTITTCRRSLSDFQNLMKFLRLEHPASYLPDVPHFRSPFQMYSKPSRAVVHEAQEHLDRLLKILLTHPTFAMHELLWEFFLVPEMEHSMIEERSSRKAAVLKESIAEDYRPLTNDNVREIEQIVSHALEAVRGVGHSTAKLIRRGHALQHVTTDFADAISICAAAVSTLQPPTNILPRSYVDAFSHFAAAYSNTSHDASPLVQFVTSLTSNHTTTIAVENALTRPTQLLTSLTTSSRNLSRLRSAVASSSLPRKFTFPGMEESRQRTLREQEAKITHLEGEIDWLGKEAAWTKDVAVGELAGWTAWREATGREAIRGFARATLIRERELGKKLERCLRSVRQARNDSVI